MPRGIRWLIVGAFVAAVAVLVVSVRLIDPSRDVPRSPTPSAEGVTANVSTPSGAGADDVAEDDAVGGQPAVAGERTLRLDIRRWPDGASIPGARWSVSAGERTLVREARASATGGASLPLPAETQQVWVAAWAPDHDGAEALVDLTTESGDVTLELVPQRGWIGRVVGELGDPVARAHVDATRFWPPRPALLDHDDGSPADIVSRQGVEPAHVTSATNEDGYYYVEPFDDGNVVDLVLTVVGTDFATERVRVALPLPDVWLPDLVVAPGAPLHGRVSDSSGRPVSGAAVAVDRGIGRERRVEETVVTDANGAFVVPRALASLHLRVEQADHGLEVARADGRELSPVDGWIEVGLETRLLTVELAAADHVRGRVLDAASGQPLDSGVAVVRRLGQDGEWETIAEGLVGADGGYDVLVPAQRGGDRLSLSLSAPGYRTLERDAAAELDATLPPQVDYLPLASDASTVVGRVHSLEGLRADEATVRVWVSENPGPFDFYEVRTTGVPESYRLEWEGAVERDGSFEWHTTARPSDHVLAFAHRPSRDGLVEWGSRGPEPLHAMRSRSMTILMDRTVELDVHVHGRAPSGALFLEHSRWHPLGSAVWSRSLPLDLRRDEEVLSVSGPGSGFMFLEVRLDRGPVSAPVAALDDWVDVRRLPSPRIDLDLVEFHSVQGTVVSHTEQDWPDLCVALVGDAVPVWRAEWLGESDWCVRPDRQGRYRLDAVPRGEYLVMLYRPAGTEGVEVLAQRALAVEADLFNVDVWEDGASVTAGLR